MTTRQDALLRGYVAVVCVSGLALLTALARGGNLALTGPFFVFSGFVLAGELVAIHVPRRGEEDEITTSTTFTFALLLTAGPVAAVVSQAVASVAADAVRRKSWWKALFNVCQYTLSIGAAGGVLDMLGYSSSSATSLQGRHLATILLGAAAFFLVNNVLCAIALAMAQRTGIVSYVMADVRGASVADAVLLGLSPVVVVISDASIQLLPLLLLPLGAVYFGARASLQKARSEERFRSLVANSADLITILDVEGRIRYQSPSSKASVVPAVRLHDGRAAAEFVHPHDRDLFLQRLARAIDHPSAAITVEYRMRGDDGAWHDFEGIYQNLLDTPAVDGLVLNSRDITERKRLERELAHQAFHDPLTGLANRILFRERVEHAIARTAREAGLVAVLFLDLDNFKSVNDTLGHTTGDQLLRRVAERLNSAVRPGDTVARLGGDEFAVLLEEAEGPASIEGAAERLSASLASAFEVEGKELFVGATIGIAVGRSGDPADDVLRNADVAMYFAKKNGKGRYEVYTPGLGADLMRRMEMEAELKRAVEHGGFVLHYQPMMSLADGRLAGVEALVRWNHPERGVVSPADFIDIAEDSNLIVPLGKWILRQACMQACMWATQFPDHPEVFLSINLSTKQLQDRRLVADIADVLAETGLPGSSLVVEITESVMMQNLEVTIDHLQALKSLGVRIAIDDFGTGYSSLGYLAELPIDIIKIDRTFVDGMGKGERVSALTRAIVRLARTLELQIVAEGIEDVTQLESLRRLHCQYGQGYLIARPLEPAAVAHLIALQSDGREWTTASIDAPSPMLAAAGA